MVTPKTSFTSRLSRCGALLLCGVFLLSTLAGTASAAITPSYDEAYYATLDYYGQLLEGSVVKSYQTNGAGTITDYGSYDQVVNLTDGKEPASQDGAVTFQVDGDTDGRFYFEGKTAVPFQQLPWTIQVSYRLNGVETPAENLGGKTGEVEINIDVTPNDAASEYAKNNFVLEAAAMFNADDILSLEAPGAQVQLIGNLRAVLFMALPGQEEHFTIRVGSEDFSFSGLTFMVQPATLMQLNEISTLREAKDDIESSYDDISASLNAILDALDGMSGSLNATADGLDQLNDARAQISAGKGSVYKSADGALAGLAGVSQSMQPIGGYLDEASAALTKATSTLTSLNTTLTGLKAQTEASRTLITKTKADVVKLQALLEELEGYNKSGLDTISDVREDLSQMGQQAAELGKTLTALKRVLSAMQQTGLSPINNVTIPVSDSNSMTVAQLEAAVQLAKSLQSAYSGLSAQEKAAMGCTSYERYVEFMLLAEGIAKAQGLDTSTDEAKQQAIAAVISTVLAPNADPANGITYLAVAESLAGSDSVAAAKSTAAQLSQLLQLSQTEAFQSQLTQAKVIDNLIGTSQETGTVNGTIGQVNTMLSTLLTPTRNLVAQLEAICQALNDSDGLSDHLDSALLTLHDLMLSLEDHEGEAGKLLDDANDAGTLLSDVSVKLDSLLDNMDQLHTILTDYEPTAQAALKDGKQLADSASAGIVSLQTCLQALETLMKQSGVNLDAGAQQTLSGLAAALRQSTVGLRETGSIRDAKDSITDRVEDEWNTYTGDDNRLLLIDPEAAIVSLTSAKNPAPESIQFLMRTQEIKADSDDTQDAAAQAESANGTFWSRVGQMFKDFWTFLTGWLH